MNLHQSDSLEQRTAESLVLKQLSIDLGVDLAPRSLTLDGGARIDVDGVSQDESTFVEVFSHQGRLKGGQVHKVARDALKLITLARGREDTRLIVAFCDQTAASCVTGRSWLAEALRAWGIEVRVVEIDEEIREGLVKAQLRQTMINPTPDSPA